MKKLGKLFAIAAVVAGGVMVMRLGGPRLCQRMERMFEEASDDFPPKWMFLNITAIRENTERILSILQEHDVDTEVA